MLTNYNGTAITYDAWGKVLTTTGTLASLVHNDCDIDPRGPIRSRANSLKGKVISSAEAESLFNQARL